MAEEQRKQEETREDFGAKRVVYTLPNMEEAIVRSDMTYKTVGTTELKMDVYYPSNYEGETKLPAVLYVHGDANAESLKNAKDWGQYVSWSQLTAATGLIAVTFNHRSSEGLTHVYDAASDIDDVIDYVRNNSDLLGIDANKLCLWTCSAGSPFGLRSALHNTPSYIRCIICYYGITDLQVYLDDEEKQPSFTLGQDVLEEFSAATYTQKAQSQLAPMFIARAGLDHPNLNASIDRLVAATIAKNGTLDFMNHPTGRHAFDIRDDNARSYEIIKATLEFMKTHLLRE